MPTALSSAHFMLKLGFDPTDDACMSLRVDSTNPVARAFIMNAERGIRSALAALNYTELRAMPGFNGLVDSECPERIRRACALPAGWISRSGASKQASLDGARTRGWRVESM